MKIKTIFVFILFFLFVNLESQESFFDSKESLRFFQFEDEALYLNKKKGSPLESVVLQYGSIVIIKNHDDEGREILRRSYEQKDDEDILREKESFFYKDNNTRAYKKVYINYIENYSILSLYDENYRLESIEKRTFDIKKKIEEGKLLVKELYLWDEKERLLEKEEIFEKSHIRYVNSYEKLFASEYIYDQKKFLNNVLQEEKMYMNENEYLKISYLPDGFRVFSFFNENVKTEEIFYRGETILRRLIYE